MFERRSLPVASLLLVLAACPAASEGTPIATGPSLLTCEPVLLDGGAVGSALQLLPKAVAAEAEWRPGLSLIGVTGVVAPDGTDPGGSWSYLFGSPSVAGRGTVSLLPNEILVTGACQLVTHTPAISNWDLDSPAALALAADAGCEIGPTSTVQLFGVKDPASPLAGIDPAWTIQSQFDGGISSCVVDATTGAFGIPDGGENGTGDAGVDAG